MVKYITSETREKFLIRSIGLWKFRKPETHTLHTESVSRQKATRRGHSLLRCLTISPKNGWPSTKLFSCYSLRWGSRRFKKLFVPGCQRMHLEFQVIFNNKLCLEVALPFQLLVTKVILSRRTWKDEISFCFVCQAVAEFFTCYISHNFRRSVGKVSSLN